MSELFDLRAWLAAEIAREEEESIRRHRAAGLMKVGDQAYILALARNSVRREILARLDTAIVESTASANAVEESKPGTTLLNEHPDTSRLNWLENHPFTAYRERYPDHGELYDHFTLVDEDRKPRVGLVTDTLRAAIDASRAGDKQ